MSKVFLPKGYKSYLNLYETQTAIGLIHSIFERELANNLNLKRVSAPLIVDPNTGLNDDLNGIERPVKFDIKETNTEAVVVHSLAKWKRMALARYNFSVGEGLYTDMNAIRRDEELDNIHSIYVDQWDWERVIEKSDRNIEFLKDIVKKIVHSVYETQKYLLKEFPNLEKVEPLDSDDVFFITTQELEDMYPSLTPKERENALVKEHSCVFLMQIGDILKSGIKHDGRAPDYDDWTLNGDIIVYNKILDSAFEISSMGIRVSEKSLDEQLKKANADSRRNLPFHKALLEGKLPYTIGGGIGQSRLSMLLLGKAHIGEVQSSIWDDDTMDICAENGIILL